MSVLSFIAALVQALAWPIAIVTLAVIFRRQLRTLVVQFAGRMKDLKSLRAPGTEIQFADTLLATQVEIAQLAEVAEKATDKETTDKESQQEPGPKPRLREPAKAEDQYVPPLPEIAKWAQHKEAMRAAEDPYVQPLPDIATWAQRQVAMQAAASALLSGKGSPEETVQDAWRYVDDSIRAIARDMRIWLDNGRGEWWAAWIVLDTLEQRGAISDSKDILSIIQKLITLKNSVIFGNTVVSRFEAYEYWRSALQVVEVIRKAYVKMHYQDRIRDESSEPSEP